MAKPLLEVADIFQRYGENYRQKHQGHISLDQLKVMSAIERCRTAELGGHVLLCENCGALEVSYNSCRNRHCPKCQSAAAQRWLLARQQDLLPVGYFHVVFTLPEVLRDIAYQNKKMVYTILFRCAAETLLRIAGDPKHLGAHIGMTMVLHTWGSSLVHHPHVHCIVPGGGLSEDKQQWIGCRPGFFLPVRVLSRLFRRLFLQQLEAVHKQGGLHFYGHLDWLNQYSCFKEHLRPLHQIEWVVYAKPPFSGPSAVLAYLSRYTHRVAIANSRIVGINENGVRFTYKDYRQKNCTKQKVMCLSVDEFMRRFLLHVLPKGFQRIRHYGLLANAHRVENLARCRKALKVKPKAIETPSPDDSIEGPYICPVCKTAMVIVETFIVCHKPRGPPIMRYIS